jgi:predicted aminopeptidase
LNMPYIQKHFKGTTTGRTKTFNVPRSKYHVSQYRLWQKVRRRSKTLQQPWRHNQLNPTDVEEQAHNNAWTTLFNLSATNLNRFLTTKRLRSQSTSTLALYALWKQTSNIEEPHRSRILSQLRLIMKFRKCATPLSKKH